MLLAAITLALSMLSVGCGENRYRLGMGIIAEYTEKTDASDLSEGRTGAAVTAAAVIFDGKGRIVDSAIDSAENMIYYNSEGVSRHEEFKTKTEEYGSIKEGEVSPLSEWIKGINIFRDKIKGKKLHEVQEYLVKDSEAERELLEAGCKIELKEAVDAIALASKNAKRIEKSENMRLNIAMVTRCALSSATDKSDGKGKMEMSFSAALTSDGRIKAIKTDVLDVDFSFDKTGKGKTDTEKTLKTKYDMKGSYGMAEQGNDRNGDGKVLEWYLQSRIFDNACVGKTKEEIGELIDGEYGNRELQRSGCTIAITDMMKATLKAID